MRTPTADPARRRAGRFGHLLLTLGLAAVIVGACGQQTTPTPSTAIPSTSAGPTTTTPSASPAALSPAPSSSPSPSPAFVYEDLSGIVTAADLAHRYPMAVMLDDSPAARPQSGLAAASVVWQAPVEGGIPRYMAVFQAGTAGSIGPVRSARLYFVRWAAEWKAVYLHAGGPLPLKYFLRGKQQLVLNADGKATRRVTFRKAPHNLYSEGTRLRTYAERTLHATTDKLAYDPSQPGVLQPFRDGAAEAQRGKDGGTISVKYVSEQVAYRYDRPTNTWLRTVDGRPQYDAGDRPNAGSGAKGAGPRIAPTTVIVMLVAIRRSASITGPALGRLEADSIGSNKAWVFADGRMQLAKWSKHDAQSRTRFLDAAGAEIVLPRGQIFIQVVSSASAFSSKVEPAS
jgi:Protein of unknown function (DUF3048).